MLGGYLEPENIDYAKLADALTYYQAHGYPYMEVPWVVSREAELVTLPTDREATSVHYGELVGSGEQSFIELMMRGKKLSQACCITPCFRDEKTFDRLHHAYFMKLELIDCAASLKNLDRMMQTAQEFFSRYTDVLVIKTSKHSYDIIDKKHGIELGSYGFRSFNKMTFLYGTGIALPRLDTVLAW